MAEWGPATPASDRPLTSDAEEGAAESGFTLLELMMVMLIMAILLAIAIPTFSGAAVTTSWRDAQSRLVNSVISADTIYDQSVAGQFNTGPVAHPGFSLAQQAMAVQPELLFTTKAVDMSDVPPDVSIDLSADGEILILTDQSSDDHCWFVEDNKELTATNDGLAHATATQGVTYGESLDTRATCKASTIGGGGTFSGFGAKFPAFT